MDGCCRVKCQVLSLMLLVLPPSAEAEMTINAYTLYVLPNVNSVILHHTIFILTGGNAVTEIVM